MLSFYGGHRLRSGSRTERAGLGRQDKSGVNCGTLLEMEGQAKRGGQQGVLQSGFAPWYRTASSPSNGGVRLVFR